MKDQPSFTSSVPADLSALHQHAATLEQRAEELDAQMAMYTQTLDAISDLVFIKDSQSRIVYANNAFCTFFGMALDQLRGHLDAPFNPPDYTQHYIEDDLTVFSSGQPLTIAAEPITRHDGVVRLFQTLKSPIFDAQGQVVRLVGIARDITERRLLEQERTQLQADAQYQGQRLESLIANVPGVVWEVTGQPNIGMQRVTFVNAYVETLLGYSVAEWLATPQFWLTIIHPDDQARVAADVGTSFAQRVPSSVDFRWIAKDGRVAWIEAHMRPLYDAAGALVGIRGLALDITARKQAEAEQQRLQSEIMRAQEATVRELSTPLIPISDRVLVLPLIGSVDEWRASQVMETLLHGLSQSRATVVILDITGVAVVDTPVADGLVRSAQAVKLLGAQLILTGIRPEVAETLVHLGADLSQIITRSTLQSGIALAQRWS